MSVLDQLSSQVGDRTEKSNLKVVAQCLIEPALLAEIAEGLANPDAACAGDCAEVMTKVLSRTVTLTSPPRPEASSNRLGNRSPNPSPIFSIRACIR